MTPQALWPPAPDRRRGRGLLAAALLLGIATGGSTETLLPPDPSRTIGEVISFAGFVDEAGRDFASAAGTADARGQPAPWVVSPIYTRCMHTCSALTTSLKRALADSGTDPAAYRVLSFSFDPAETAEGLHAFRAKANLPPDWLTLRAGDAQALARTLNSLDFRTIALGDGQFQHPNLVAILAPDMRLASYVFGVNFSPGDLGRAIRRARSGVSWLDAWRSSLFFFAAIGFLASAIVFVFLLYRRRSPARGT